MPLLASLAPVLALPLPLLTATATPIPTIAGASSLRFDDVEDDLENEAQSYFGRHHAPTLILTLILTLTIA